jgi:hypothetical protein
MPRFQEGQGSHKGGRRVHKASVKPWARDGGKVGGHQYIIKQTTSPLMGDALYVFSSSSFKKQIKED